MLTERRQRRPIVVGSHRQSAKSLGHHTDNLERDPVNQEAASKNGGVAGKQPSPAAVAEDHHRLSSRWLVVSRNQRASDRGGDADHLEEIARHQRAKYQAAVDAAVDVRDLRVDAGEDARFSTEGVELRAGETHALAVGGSRPLHGEHLMHVWHRIDSKDERVQHRERHGDQAQPKRHRRDDGHGHQGSALKGPERVEDVAQRVLDERGPARVATLLPDLLDAPERSERLEARCVRRQAGRLQPLSFAFEMELQFLGQIRFTASAEEQGSESGAQDGPEAHGQVLCNTRLTPVERRSHFETSTSSCLRPAFVSE